MSRVCAVLLGTLVLAALTIGSIGAGSERRPERCLLAHVSTNRPAGRGRAG